MTFRPLDYQPPLNSSQHILTEKPDEDCVPLDVLFVGGGPAGLAGAIHLAQLVQKEQQSNPSFPDVEIGVLEKSANLGEHCLSGAVLNPVALQELFPEKQISDFPLRTPVQQDEVYFMTESGNIRIPTPPTMHNKDNYVASICEVVRWMGEQAEELGVNILAGFPAKSLLVEDHRVIGVRTTETGLNRDGQPGSQHMPATDVTAQVTVLTEGTRGPLTQEYLKWQKIQSDNPQIFALGVKEIWETKKVPKGVIHTLGWPLPKTAFGGSFMYPMADNLVALGLVVGLDYKDHNLDVHQLLQNMKQHKLFKQYLDGGELVEWGAKTIPEGGYYALPKRMHGDGLIMAGDTVGMVNVPALKGIHYAMKSGMLAAESILEGLKNSDTSSQSLKTYDQKVLQSYIGKDLKQTRNMRLAFKSGFFMGGFKAAMMTATKGCVFGGQIKTKEDAAEEKISTDKLMQKTDNSVSKVDAVYLSGNKTRDDIPSHLTVGKDVVKEVAEMYVSMCPAGVYELSGDQLVVNAPNCVDCKATDVLGPRWEPREGGSGPQYRRM